MINVKQIVFNGNIDNFKAKNSVVNIQISTSAKNLSLDSLNEIAKNQIQVVLESNQLEMIDSETK
ncbi:hypothetical protein NX781_04175 [Lactobacillus kullabergensis]|uniref:hypothetical protein n=1 Tax=Lactobacillus kullabergensis TaxID=1218493 RepID=UPI002247A4B3|nr:hypothetical protein [Lactobacillus kullabergensis]MCX0291001.1 hypothetical protein [Lactobacillus kullabergensis]